MSSAGAVKIVNGGKFLKISKLKAQLTEMGVPCKKVEVFSNGEVAAVYDSVQEAQRAADVVPQLKNYRGEQMVCKLIENYVIHEQKPKKQSASDKPDCSDSAPDKQKTLDETICPLYAHDDELLTKQRLVRNALQHQAERLLRGQTVQSQFDIYKTHTLER